jgi:hypothetical protein
MQTNSVVFAKSMDDVPDREKNDEIVIYMDRGFSAPRIQTKSGPRSRADRKFSIGFGQARSRADSTDADYFCVGGAGLAAGIARQAGAIQRSPCLGSWSSAHRAAVT